MNNVVINELKSGKFQVTSDVVLVLNPQTDRFVNEGHDESWTLFDTIGEARASYKRNQEHRDRFDVVKVHKID